MKVTTLSHQGVVAVVATEEAVYFLQEAAAKQAKKKSLRNKKI
jgi:hypothetical protein